MNYRRASWAFALPVSLALACTACGHGNQDHTNEPAPNATVSNPAMQPAPGHTAPNPNMAPLPNGASVGQPGSNTTLGPEGTGQAVDFDMLAGSKGYITKTDAMRNPWMNRHFDECDSNHDGKVTHAEFDACRKAAEPTAGTTAG